MANSGEIAAVYERMDRAAAAKAKTEAENATRFAPARPVMVGPTRNDLKDLAKADRAMQAARRLPHHTKTRADAIDRAVSQREAIEARIAERERLGRQAQAVQEAAHLERLRGGAVVEDEPRLAPGRCGGVKADGMDAVQALWRDAPTPAARLTFRRAWVAGMLYRAMLERSTKGAGIGGSGEGEPDGGLLSRLGAKGMAMVKVTEADKLLARIHKAFGPTARGQKELAVLQHVAGCGRSISAMAGGGGAHGRSGRTAMLALLRALDTVALLLKLP